MAGAVVAGALAAATGCTAGRAGRVPAPAAPASTTRPPGATPPRSAAAAPAAPATVPSTAPVEPLVAALDGAVAGTNSCLVVTDGTTGAVRYSRRGDVPLAPASTQKLLVAAAALDRLGPVFRFTTTVNASRPPSGGQVDNLWLIGSGDPLLASPAYTAYLHSNPATAGYPTTPVAGLADQLVAAGVKNVPGGLHGDDSRYEPLRYLPTWSAKINVGEFDIGPLSGLEVDQGLQQTRPDIRTPDPAGFGANVLAQLFTDRGGSVGSTTDQIAPHNTVVLAKVQSAPLSQIVAAMLQASDNQIAELLVREIDRQAGGAGTTAGGVRIVMAEAARLGLPTTGLSMVDGSGLSAANRVTCPTLLAALDLGDTPRFASLNSGLPVAGVNGTMYNFLKGTPAAGHLAAKGGYITGVSALVGRITVGHPYRFAYIVNGPFDYLGGLGLLEKVVSVLST